MGETECLRWARRLRILAVSVLAVLFVLTVLSSALLWSAHTFFPLTDGQLLQEEAVAEAHFRLMRGAELVDGVLLTAALFGFLALVLSMRGEKHRVGVRKKLAYMVLLAAGIALLPLPFALTDPVFTPVDYLLTPAAVVARMLLFFLADSLLCFTGKQGRKRTKKQDG